MPDKNFLAFRSLLWHAIGSRTQAQFANEAGISAEHLNRMLNASKINRPTKKTLSLIAAAAKNGVSYGDLEAALERDTNPTQEKQATEAELAPDFWQIAEGTVKTLSDILIERHKDAYPCVVDSLDAAVSALVEEVKNAYPYAPQVSFEIGRPRSYIGVTHQDVPLQSTVWLSMADYNTSASTEMIIYYSEVAGKPVLHDISIAVADISDLYGLPFNPQDEENDKDSDDDVIVGPPLGNHEDPYWDAAYYINFEENLHFQEYRYSDPGVSMEQRILDAVFGGDTICPLWIQGTGFYLDEIPSDFATFVFKHRKALAETCSASGEPEDGISGEQFLTRVAELEVKGAGNEEVAAWLNEVEYADRLSLVTGWIAAVSAIMAYETGFEFLSYVKQDNKEFGDLTQHDVVLISREYTTQKEISREAVLNLVYRYAAELGISEFRDMLYKTVEPRNIREHRYVIRERQPRKEEQLAQKKPEYVPFVVDNERQYPAESGIYAVKLKDGREMSMVYLKAEDKNLWLKRHKEWSHMIELYDPAPLPSFPN